MILFDAKHGKKTKFGNFFNQTKAPTSKFQPKQILQIENLHLKTKFTQTQKLVTE